MFKWFNSSATRRIYLDHAAASPVCAEALQAMGPFLNGGFGNPSAIHTEGRVTREAIESARTAIARVLEVPAAGVVFVSGGTEGNALAIVGSLTARMQAGQPWSDMEIVSTAIEHPSVSLALSHLASLGVVVKTVPVDSVGLITPAALGAQLSPKTVLVTFAYANSEIGVVQRVRELARTIRAYERRQQRSRILLHVDGAQAPLWLPCQLPRLDVDLLTLDGGKCGGPKGSGALIVRGEVIMSPVLWGGGQERGRRPGTENVSAVVGFAAALLRAQTQWEKRARAVAQVRDAGVAMLKNTLPSAVLNGPIGTDRIANNINISIPGLDTEYAVVVLDSAGIAASTKSACAGAGGGESVVVRSVSGDADRARSTIRFTLGEETTPADLSVMAQTLADHCALMTPLTK